MPDNYLQLQPQIAYMQNNMDSSDFPSIQLAAEMRLSLQPSRPISKNESLDEFYNLVADNGFQMNPKLFAAKFQLPNGLPYSGIATNQTISQGEVLLRVPEHMILSSVKAFREPMLAQVYKDDFIKNSELWQDRVLTVYCLYLLTLPVQKDNIWQTTVRHIPQSCDMGMFWPDNLVKTIRDSTVLSAIRRKRQQFELQWEQFQKCKQRHAILQNEDVFNKEKYKIVFSNIQNRSFGKYLSHLSIVPFADFINHHSTKVYYTTEKHSRNEFSVEEEKDDESSVGSEDSLEYIGEDGQFDYASIGSPKQNTEFFYENESLNARYQQIKTLSVQSLRWNDFTLEFIIKVWKLLAELNDLWKSKSIQTEQALARLSSVKHQIKQFIDFATIYYKIKKQKPYISPPKVDKSLQYPEGQANFPKQYESLVINSTSFDRFQANSQIYFRYGRDSNRALLLNYGFTIENNKYDHEWISFKMGDKITHLPGILQIIQAKKESLHQKFKLYHHVLNMDIIIFKRLSSWQPSVSITDVFHPKDLQREIDILKELIDIYTSKLLPIDEHYDLTSKELTYCQYFIAVYHKEKRNILKKQIKMLQTLIRLLNRLIQGQSKQQASRDLTESQSKILGYYIANIRQ